MKLSNVCTSYLNGFKEIANYKNNDKNTNALAVLKIFSYILLSFVVLYGVKSLKDRLSKKTQLSSVDKGVNNQATKTILKGSTSSSQPKQLDIEYFKNKARIYVEKNSENDQSELLKYIFQILNNTSFQADPEMYMQKWIKIRGCTEEYRMPEDQALRFFQDEVLPQIKNG
ncbi:MAG: hypothetical protein H0W88_03395 [Parachlamydiaceae bacterium]|nr:hypothetical protein [Parachlamydiaceae bacterium]